MLRRDRIYWFTRFTRYQAGGKVTLNSDQATLEFNFRSASALDSRYRFPGSSPRTSKLTGHDMRSGLPNILRIAILVQ
jgi:hypothetical protein